MFFMGVMLLGRLVDAELSRRGWWAEGVGAKSSISRQSFRLLFSFVQSLAVNNRDAILGGDINITTTFAMPVEHLFLRLVLPLHMKIWPTFSVYSWGRLQNFGYVAGFPRKLCDPWKYNKLHEIPMDLRRAP